MIQKVIVLIKRPYRTFNETIEQSKHILSGLYTGIFRKILPGKSSYRLQAGARLGAENGSYLAHREDIQFGAEKYNKLNSVPVIRQMLIYPPLVIQQPMNKRTGHFKKITKNPLDLVSLTPEEWILLPRQKLGSLL